MAIKQGQKPRTLIGSRYKKPVFSEYKGDNYDRTDFLWHRHLKMIEIWKKENASKGTRTRRNEAKYQRVRELREKGMTYHDIGVIEGITGERVRQLLRDMAKEHEQVK